MLQRWILERESEIPSLSHKFKVGCKGWVLVFLVNRWYFWIVVDLLDVMGSSAGVMVFGLYYGLMQLNELAELRDGSYENTRIYKEQTKKWHDSRLRGDKDFKVGDQVLLYNSRLKMYPRKIKSKWSGPNIVKTVYPHGAIEITDRDRFSFKVNGQRLKKYYRGDIDKEDDDVLEFKNGVT
ncbi:hypothetical protein Tco_1510285 [Tanacetum coccineum]